MSVRTCPIAVARHRRDLWQALAGPHAVASHYASVSLCCVRDWRYWLRNSALGCRSCDLHSPEWLQKKARPVESHLSCSDCPVGTVTWSSLAEPDLPRWKCFGTASRSFSLRGGRYLLCNAGTIKSFQAPHGDAMIPFMWQDDIIGFAPFLDACLENVYPSAGPPVGDQASDQP